MKQFILILMLALFLCPLSANAALIGYWNFDEGTGSTVFDSSPNNYDGTIYGATNWVAGKYGNALDFDGLSTYIGILGSESAAISNGITIEAWIKFDDVTPNPLAANTIVGKWAVGDRAFYLGQGGNNDKFEYDLWANGDAWILGSSAPYYNNTAPVAGEWIHVAATYDGSIANFYLNGVLDSFQAATGLIHQGGRPIEIGGVSAGFPHYFDGIIDEVRIYNNALTRDEILLDMNGEAVIPEPSTILMVMSGLLGLPLVRGKR